MSKPGSAVRFGGVDDQIQTGRAAILLGDPEDLSLLSRPRPRILAMHGAKSNDEVTMMQLRNLGITDENYDIVYLRGNVKVEQGDESIAEIVQGPYFSWFDVENLDDAEDAIITCIRDILNVVQYFGPFDGVYGFSNGAAMAMLVAGIADDPSLRKKLNELKEKEQNKKTGSTFSRRGSTFSRRGSTFSRRLSNFGMSTRNIGMSTRNIGMSTRNIGMSTRNIGMSKRDIGVSGRQLTMPAKDRTSVRSKMKKFSPEQLKTDDDFVVAPFKFVIFSHAASHFKSVMNLRQAAGLDANKHLDLGVFTTPSFHLLGIEDSLKSQGEKIASLYSNRKVLYLPGGHGISREQRKDKVLQESIDEFTMSFGNPPPKVPTADFKTISKVTQIAVLPHAQIALIKFNRANLPSRKAEGATIISLLEEWNADRPFLRESRVADVNKCTTYGDIREFIKGGKGDLRRIGVKPGEVIAYGAPPGGGAAPALAFLAFGAQTATAPLAPSTAEPDALDALEQFHVTHLVLFEGVNCPGVEAAFKKYVSMGKGKLHKAVISNGNQPGIFDFVDQEGRTLSNKELTDKPLKNGETDTCLLLRTSGTTARPKGVPLQQDALVNNGVILASSMQLKENDVCYSVMPLFHIGGISASIMCTLATGGSVCCDSEPFDPSRMVDALALSRPQPTWYSSVPTIHNATVSFLKDLASTDPKYNSYGVDENGIWAKGHSLRMIRSGAAALLGPDGEALTKAYGGIPIFPTYSMSEQMPISQPPAGKGDTLTDKPGSVGMPVAASTAIVNRSTLRPVKHGEEGEIAISGETVLKNYLENPEADSKAYFDLTLDIGSNILGDITTGGFYFLTGDVGTIDRDGFLSLKGRAKELIKKGGEQVSPFEVEEPLLNHPWVKTPICFPVPSKLYGEEVGCALVLSTSAPEDLELRDLVKAMRSWLKEVQVAPVKWPTKWKIVKDEELPKTKTKKYIRIGLSTHLGMNPVTENKTLKDTQKDSPKARIDWACLSGLRFLLACYVMFMHIGSDKSWSYFNNLRGLPWHVHVFFTLGGYSMASPMNPVIKKKFAYFKARIWAMYPMYAIALVFLLINLLVVCRPSTFDKNFHWGAQDDDLTRGFYCEGTAATPESYWGSLVLTIVTYILGMAITPGFLLSWWMGYYLFFSSMYYQCLAVFPITYNTLYMKTKSKTRLLLMIIIGLMLLNVGILCAAWFSMKDAEKFDDNYDAAKKWNIGILSWYLFGPFWGLYFVIGAATAFLYDAYRPNERHNAWIWGFVADGCTLTLIAFSIATIAQGKSFYGENDDLEMFMRPDEANQLIDTAVVDRMWDAGYARMFCPLTTLWIFALSTGRGLTANFFAQPFLYVTLSPHAYNCYLFHQPVAQWYYAATRKGDWWNWWNYRKTMYWFSPEPCPTEWYEYFLVVGLVVGWSHLMNENLEPAVGKIFDSIINRIGKGKNEEIEEDSTIVIMNIISGMTGIEPQSNWTMEECGLASIGLPSLVALLNKNFSKKGKNVTITAADLISAETIADMAIVVDEAKKLSDARGV